VKTTTRVTQYEVSVLAEDNINHGTYAINVEYRGEGRWAVVRHRFCLGADGEWDFEVRPSEREDEWLAGHRFDLETALRLAEQAAPEIVVNGRSAKDVA
jgi:hypothetical protein